MGQKELKPLVYTVKDLCRVCYTCVRECPVKAIRIIDGQAEVLADRCIACGNCTIVCKQGAKVYERSIEGVKMLFHSDSPVYGMLAPSFVAEFEEAKDPGQFVGMLKKLGFTYGEQEEKFVVTIEGSELARGGGGCRCMSMPVLRDEV